MTVMISTTCIFQGVPPSSWPAFKSCINEPDTEHAMATTAAEMLRTALDAFTTEDAALSREIIKQDKLIDASYKRVFNELIEIMIDNPSSTASAAQLLFVANARQH